MRGRCLFIPRARPHGASRSSLHLQRHARRFRSILSGPCTLAGSYPTSRPGSEAQVTSVLGRHRLVHTLSERNTQVCTTSSVDLDDLTFLVRDYLKSLTTEPVLTTAIFIPVPTLNMYFGPCSSSHPWRRRHSSYDREQGWPKS